MSLEEYLQSIETRLSHIEAKLSVTNIQDIAPSLRVIQGQLGSLPALVTAAVREVVL